MTTTEQVKLKPCPFETLAFEAETYSRVHGVLVDSDRERMANLAAGIRSLARPNPPSPDAGERRESIDLDDVNRLANVMLDTWKRVDPNSAVAKYPASYIANFADMARAILALSPAPDADTVMVPRDAGELADAVAGALAKYGVAYSHATLMDMATADRKWRVHETGYGNPFDRDEWLGEFDNKPDANAFCAELRRAAAIKAAEEWLAAAQVKPDPLPADDDCDLCQGIMSRACPRCCPSPQPGEVQ